MKKLICAFIVGLWCVGGFAQGNQSTSKENTPEQRAERVTNWMTKKLTLTADQKSKVYDVNLKYAKLNQATRTNDSDNRKAMYQDLKASEKEHEGELKAILTPEQFQTFQTAKQELIEKGQARRKKS